MPRNSWPVPGPLTPPNPGVVRPDSTMVTSGRGPFILSSAKKALIGELLRWQL